MMKSLTDAFIRRLTPQGWLTAMLLALLSLLSVASIWHSTTKPEPTPTETRASIAQGHTAPGPAVDRPILAGTNQVQAMVTQNGNFTPFLHVIPSQEGTELYISAGSPEVGGAVFVNIGIGPGHEKGGWTMTYSDTTQAYVSTVTGFTAGVDDYAELSITTTLGLDTGIVEFNRAHIQASTPRTIFSQDSNLELELVNTDTFTYDTYIAVTPSFGLPGPLPEGHRLVGSAYSVRAAGALAETDRPMSLRLGYNDVTLAGADPHTLAIFAWDAFNRRWDNLGGTLHTSPRKHVSVATSRFATYALVTTTIWRDEFFDLSGLEPSQLNNVTSGGPLENPMLILSSTPGSGSAISQLISPTTAISNWGTLTFTSTAAPPATFLTVDVLGPDETEVLSNVVSGTSLVDLVDAAQYPSLRLRVNMDSTTEGNTPALDAWQLSWWVERHQTYLPLVLKQAPVRNTPPPTDISIDIDPPVPVENDVIRITPSGSWGNVCIPTYQSHQIAGNVIRIDAVANPFDMYCATIVMPWKFTVEVGPLHAGLYAVEVYIARGSYGWPILYGTKSLMVSTE